MNLRQSKISLKCLFAAILWLLLTATAILPQTTNPSSAKTAQTEKNSPTVSTTPKRADLNNLASLTGHNAPDSVAADITGTEYNFETLRGKIVVINLWAMWCKPCIAEMPELNDLVNKFKAKEVIFLGAAPEDKTVLEGFFQKYPFNYRIIPGAIDIIKKYSPKEKPNAETGKSRIIQALLTHIVIDRDGKTVKRSWGFSAYTVAELTKTIEQLLVM